MDDVFNSQIITARVMHVKKAHRYAEMTRQFIMTKESNLSPTCVILLSAAISLSRFVLMVLVQKDILLDAFSGNTEMPFFVFQQGIT